METLKQAIIGICEGCGNFAECDVQTCLCAKCTGDKKINVANGKK